ncbi:craniofacial development protein 2-like [Acyrthosiphon pisum]|uniref:Craniofacial development protein 2-like n=1 Tax=Acyrthosiphon pisum TaxID=7029 RepID=A0A8R2F8X6_ACYPI|nr:craniofacial development protein 2-like [Acyrthosiphon pisum]|eukprot:XP_008181873.1 PREDICTED: craniofacial development protein 2-like [Acyrthosiphon pisum]
MVNDSYEVLERTFDLLPKNCIKVTVGDFNAQIGKEAPFRPTIGHGSLHNTSNDNGMKLIDFSMAKNLIISSTYFPRKNIHKQTWTSPDGKTKSQIDHVVIDKRYQTCIKNFRTYSCADGDSDHYLVFAKFVLTLSINWRNKKQFNKAVKLDGDK